MNLKVVLFSFATIATVAILYNLFSSKSFSTKENELANDKTSPTGIISLLPQIDAKGEITVKVSPQDLSESAETWDFEILLDTHSQNLGDLNLLNNSVLIDDRGNQFNPISWESLPADKVEPPQEHHRQGVLKFKPISERPESIELKIQSIDRIDERIFKWDLK